MNDPLLCVGPHGRLRRAAACAVLGAALLAPAATAEVPRCFGKVWRAAGEVQALSEQGTRTLREGDAVYVGEHLRAASGGEAVVQTIDAGIVALRPGAEMVPLEYVASGQRGDHASLRIVKGALRLVTGWIGKVNKPGIEIATPTATIGIRGTDHEPYVLPEDLADATPYEAGSYDKVNHGAVVLKTAAGEVQIKAGQIGFASAPPEAQTPPPSSDPNRSLMTLLLPRLLDKVPDFYVAGRFEHDIDEYSGKAAALIDARLAQAQADPQAAQNGVCGAAAQAATAQADARAVARDWIAHFDAAVLGRDTRTVLALIARDAKIEATVGTAGGKLVTQHFSRKQFARSATAALQGLADYRQARQTLDASNDGARVHLTSHVVESGSMNGQPYRVESDEEYLLERRDGRWVAVSASTRQR